MNSRQQHQTIRRCLQIGGLAILALQLSAAEVVVFAAASLSESLQEIGAAYEKRTGDRIRFNFGASSLLSRQIEEGAGADLFFSADEAKMDALDRKGLVVRNTRANRLGNSLVIVVGHDSPLRLTAAGDLASPQIHRLALAEPSTVPAGIYAREYLVSLKLWDQLADRVVPTENVRAALAAVESGNVDAGIVYKTDAAISKKVVVAFEVSPSEGPQIRYPLALLKDSRNALGARAFLEELNGKAAGAVFRRFGFLVLERPE